MKVDKKKERIMVTQMDRQIDKWMVRGSGGQVVNVFAFYSDNPSSIPAGYLNFLHRKTKIN